MKNTLLKISIFLLIFATTACNSDDYSQVENLKTQSNNKNITTNSYDQITILFYYQKDAKGPINARMVFPSGKFKPSTVSKYISYNPSKKFKSIRIYNSNNVSSYRKADLSIVLSNSKVKESFTNTKSSDYNVVHNLNSVVKDGTLSIRGYVKYVF